MPESPDPMLQGSNETLPTPDNEASKLTDHSLCNLGESKRILITNINNLLGQSLFEQIRNDHILIDDASGAAPHRFLGTLNTAPASGLVNKSPSESIKILDFAEKPKTFKKQVQNADFVILDLTQFNSNIEEAETVLKALRTSEEAKNQTLIVVSSPMTWSNSPARAQPYTDKEQE